MKMLGNLLLILLVFSGTAEATQATPIWSLSSGFDSRNYLKAGATVGNGIRFNIGYDFGRNDVTGNEEKSFIAGIDKQLKENWWVKVGYQNGNSQLGSINVSSVYNITPNASVHVGYSAHAIYDLKNFVMTQLYIKF